MSVTGYLIFVDWTAIASQWQDDPQAFRGDGFWDDEADNPWPPRFRAEYYEPDDWVDSWKCAARADEFFTELRGDLDKAERTRWDELFGVFLQIDRRPTGYDLPGFQPDVGIANIISPASVTRLVGTIREINIDRLQVPFEARCRPDPDWWLKSFDEYRGYIRQWFAAFEAAHRSGKAVVLWVA